jgi:Glycosyl transferase family 2
MEDIVVTNSPENWVCKCCQTSSVELLKRRSICKSAAILEFRKGQNVKNTALLSVQKNEGPFLLEFVAHHIAIGFENILLMTNPSDDWTNELADALAANGIVRHMCVSTPAGAKPQEFALSIARQTFELDGLEWLLVLDGDELLNIHVGNGFVDQFLARFDETVDVVSINTACFGNHPHEIWEPGDSSCRYLSRLSSAHWRNAPSKSFIHFPVNFANFKPHGPSGFRPDRHARVALHGGLEFVDLSSADPKFYSRLRFTGASDNVHSIAQINHYIIRTYDSFLIRAARGRGSLPSQAINNRHTLDFFLSYAKARVPDTSIGKYRERQVAVRDRLLMDHSVADMHQKALARHSEKISSLKSRL